MKVVQEGSLTRRVTCPRCNSELEYEPEDVKMESYEDSPLAFHIQCPLCVKRLGPNYGSVSVKDPSSKAPKASKASS